MNNTPLLCPTCASPTFQDDRGWRVCPQCGKAVWMPVNGGLVRLSGRAGDIKIGQRLARSLLSSIAVAPMGTEGVSTIIVSRKAVFEPLEGGIL